MVVTYHCLIPGNMADGHRASAEDVPLCLVTNTFDIGENDLWGWRGLKSTAQLVSRGGGHVHKGDAQVGQIDLHLALEVEEGKDQHSSLASAKAGREKWHCFSLPSGNG